MAGYTQDGNTIPVMAPKDAEGRLVPLDVKVMYNDSGDEFEVRCFTFSTGPYGPGWYVKVYDPSDGDSSDDRGNTITLDFMHIEKPDSLKQLDADLARLANDPDRAVCTYLNRDKHKCCGCKFNKNIDDFGNRNCIMPFLSDVTARVHRFAGDAE